MADRFCSQCGAELVAEARFCISCGRSIGGGAARLAGRTVRFGRWAPVAVFGTVILVGAIAILAGRSNPVPAPVIPGKAPGAAPPMGGMAPGNPPGAMPENHPPIEIPGDVVKAINDMKAQAEAAPDNIELWTRLAGVEYRAGLIDNRYLADASKAYEHVLELDPKNLEALRHLGNIAFDQQAPVRAIDFYVRYLTLKPDDLSVQTDMATMYLSRGDAQTAMQLYQKVLEQKPDFFEALFNLGIAYRSSGDDEKAMAFFEKAKAAAPDDRGRKQVEQMIARGSGGDEAAPGGAPPAAGGAPAAGSAPAAAPAGFRGGVEAIFRSHPMIGPKVESITWESDDKVRILLRDFPMQSMPPEIRERFLGRVRSQVRDRKTADSRTAQVTIELVDPATQSVMETIVE